VSPPHHFKRSGEGILFIPLSPEIIGVDTQWRTVGVCKGASRHLRFAEQFRGHQLPDWFGVPGWVQGDVQISAIGPLRELHAGVEVRLEQRVSLKLGRLRAFGEDIPRGEAREGRMVEREEVARRHQQIVVEAMVATVECRW